MGRRQRVLADEKEVNCYKPKANRSKANHRRGQQLSCKVDISQAEPFLEILLDFKLKNLLYV